MIEEITIENQTLNQSILLTKSSSTFLLADDKAIDWGEIPATISTLSSVGQRGTKTNYVSISSGRTVSIVGWVIEDDFGSISEKKTVLNTFCDILSKIRIIVGRYKLEGIFKQAIKYSTENRENNEIICKFMLQIFCENPFFTLVDSEETSSFKIYRNDFVFPLVWYQNSPIIFGLRQGLSNFILKNSGTISTGFEAYFYIGENITSLTISNATTGGAFRLKSGVILESGDVLHINTTIGKRTIQVGSSVTELVNAFEIFDIDSDFLQIIPGENTIAISVISGDVQSLSAEFFVEPLFYAIEEQ